MNNHNSQDFIGEIFAAIFFRQPTAGEKAHWIDLLGRNQSPASMVAALRKTPEYLRKHSVRTFVPNGHYYSPVVDPESVKEYHERECAAGASEIAAVEFSADKMARVWDELEPTLKTTNFNREQSGSRRYIAEPEGFPYADAAILRAMIARSRPKRIVEIGSGKSTACMLDTIEAFGLDETRVDCVEPYPDRLRSLLRAEDYAKVRLHEKPVQQVDLSVFRQLSAGDILFIDSTHVVKTGSDVHFEFFHILPALADGVFIHFHDCPFPFEYPAKWVFEQNMSWNELYFLRAFLMYNERFNIVFWTPFFFGARADQVRSVDPRLLQTPRSGIWLVKGANRGSR